MCTAPSSFTSVPSGVSSRVFTEMSSFFFTPVINSMSCSPLFLACPGLLFQIKKSRNSFLTTVPGRDILCSRGTTRIAFFSPVFRGKTPTHLYLTRITDLPTWFPVRISCSADRLRNVPHCMFPPCWCSQSVTSASCQIPHTEFPSLPFSYCAL